MNISIEQAIEYYLNTTKRTEFHLSTALIDMDGVLYDSMPYHTIAWHRMATELGIKATREEFYLYEGMTGAATIRMLFKRAFGREDITDEEAKELYARKAKYFVEIAERKPIADAPRMTSILRDNEIERVLVTGSGQLDLLNSLKNDYPNIFDDDKRVTALDVKYGKPNPEPYLKGMDKVNRKPNECMVVENAPLGVQAGKDAGCFVVAVTTGPIPVAAMEAAGAHIVFDSMTEFADNLPTLINALK